MTFEWMILIRYDSYHNQLFTCWLLKLISMLLWDGLKQREPYSDSKIQNITSIYSFCAAERDAATSEHDHGG